MIRKILKMRVIDEDMEPKLMENADDAIEALKDYRLRCVVSEEIPEAPQIIILNKMNHQEIHFPIEDEEVIQNFTQSPVGVGAATIIDEKIRGSVELNPEDFEIMNPAWNEFLENRLMPSIQEKFRLLNPIQAELEKMFVYRQGTFFQSHRDAPTEPHLFGTLVIHLPSKFKGGELIVQHADYCHMFNYNKNADEIVDEIADENSGENAEENAEENANKYSKTFYTAFYRDSEHQVLPIISGYRSCLVYNLISELGTAVILPEATVEHKAKVNRLKSLLKEWNKPEKIVFGFDHKYLSGYVGMDELKTTDYALAKQFAEIARECNLVVLCGALMKRPVFNSVERKLVVEYSLNFLNPLSEDETPPEALHVNFEKEVILKKYHKDCEFEFENRSYISNVGIEGPQYNQITAMVFFKKEFLIDVYHLGWVESDVLEEIYFQVRKRSDLGYWNANTYKRFARWALCIAQKQAEYSEKMFEEITSYDNKSLTTTYIMNHKFDMTGLIMILSEVERYSWADMKRPITAMFRNCTRFPEGAAMLDYLWNCSVDQNPIRLEVVQVSLLTLMATFGSPKEAIARLAERQMAFRSLWLLARQLGMNIFEECKRKPLIVVVPVLVHLSENPDNKDAAWRDLATHYEYQMRKWSAAQVPPRTWVRKDVTASCECKVCRKCIQFLRSAGQIGVVTFNEIHVNSHVNDWLNKVPNMTYTLIDNGMCIEKKTMTYNEHNNHREASQGYYHRLRIALRSTKNQRMKV